MRIDNIVITFQKEPLYIYILFFIFFSSPNNFKLPYSRERKRMTSLNEAFEKLRGILPNHHRDRPLSKMEALQLAQNYIKELTATLQKNTMPLMPTQHNQTNTTSVYY